MKHVVMAATEELQHMLVVQGIVGGPPGTPCPHQAEHPQNPEVMGRRWLTDPKQLSDIVHAQLLARQQVQYPHPSGIGERLERLRHPRYHIDRR